MFILRCAVLLVVAGLVSAQYHVSVPYTARPVQSVYPGGFWYYPNYQQAASSCNVANPCYPYTLTLTNSVHSENTDGNVNLLREHFQSAGVYSAGIVREARKAVSFFKTEYGIDVGRHSDETLLAPNMSLGNGMTFNIETHRIQLYMASKGDQAVIVNTPGSTVLWTINFDQDYNSTGAYHGRIPAGGFVYYGSLRVDTCPNSGQSGAPCIFSTRPRGRKLIRVTPGSHQSIYNPGPFAFVNSRLDDEWGIGESRGVFAADPNTGIRHGNILLTFPSTCSRGGCITDY